MREKDFDCIRMKDEIQAKILKEMEQMTPEEFRGKEEAAMHADRSSDPCGADALHRPRFEADV